MSLPGNWKNVQVGMVFFLAVILALTNARGEEPTAPTLTVSTDILSQYVFRGLANSKDSAVIEPSCTVAWNGFSANLWGNFDTARHSNNPFLVLPAGQEGNSKWSETDFTVFYTRELCKNFSVEIGNVYYGLQPPSESPFGQNEDELFGGATYNFPWFTVAFTTYGEVIHSVDEWFELDFTRSIPVDMLCKGAALDLGVSFGYLTLNHVNNVLNREGATGSYSDFHTCLLTADVRFPINKYLSVAPKAGLWLPLTGKASDYLQANSLDSKSTHFFGGLNLTATF